MLKRFVRYRADIALFCGMVFWLAVLATIFRQDASRISYGAHFVEQAHAWLHGHLDVPAWLGHDLVHLGGKWYIVYPPTPALLMLPFVAVLGEHFSDIWFGWLMAAANVVLLHRLLETIRLNGWTTRTPRENVVLAVTFGTGTIALWLAIGGTVWFSAQTIAVTCTLCLLIAAIQQRWALASLALGALFLTRSPDILAAITLLVFVARAHGLARVASWQRWRLAHRPDWRTFLALVLPLAGAFVIWFARNRLYFGSFLSSGYDLQVHQDYPEIIYGLMSWHYLWPNFVVDFLNFPAFNFASPYDPNPPLDLLRDGNGTSVFFSTPLFLLFFAPQRRDDMRWLRVTLWVTIIALVTFSLFWNGIGWYQVGARYLFDTYPFAFVLLALRRDRFTWRWLALAGLGALSNLWLAQSFWCRLNGCLGSRGSAHWLAFMALLVLVPITCAAAWWWLRREQIPHMNRTDLANEAQRILDATPGDLVGGKTA